MDAVKRHHASVTAECYIPAQSVYPMPPHKRLNHWALPSKHFHLVILQNCTAQEYDIYSQIISFNVQFQCMYIYIYIDICIYTKKVARNKKSLVHEMIISIDQCVNRSSPPWLVERPLEGDQKPRHGGEQYEWFCSGDIVTSSSKTHYYMRSYALPNTLYLWSFEDSRLWKLYIPRHIACFFSRVSTC